MKKIWASAVSNIYKYLKNLIRVDETHPGLRADFEKAPFGIKRTKKSFSKQPIDLTLKQTINAKAGNKLIGISHITNLITARQRLCCRHTIRSTIIIHTMKQIGPQSFTHKVEDVTADLKNSGIEKLSIHFYIKNIYSTFLLMKQHPNILQISWSKLKKKVIKDENISFLIV